MKRYRRKRSLVSGESGIDREKHNRKPRKLLKLTGIYAAGTFVMVLVVCLFLNGSFVMDHNAAYTGTSEGGMTTLNGAMIDAHQNSCGNTTLSGVPENASDVSISYDGKYCSYISDGKLNIRDTQKNTAVRTIGPSVLKAILMHNRNIVIYLTSGSSGTLYVKTYNIDNGTVTEQKSIAIPGNAEVIKLDYSTATSTVFFNVRTGSGANARDTVYYLDIMKRLHKNSLGYAAQHIIMLEKSVTFFYTDAQGILHSKLKAVKGLENTKVRLLGSDSADNVYLQSLDNPNTLIKLDNSNGTSTVSLQDTNYKEAYCDKTGVYLIYGNYIINVASNPDSKMAYDGNLNFIGMGGSSMFFRDGNGNIVSLSKTV